MSAQSTLNAATGSTPLDVVVVQPGIVRLYRLKEPSAARALQASLDAKLIRAAVIPPISGSG